MWYESLLSHITDWLLVLFNGVLAEFTARLFYAAAEQSRDLKASISSAHAANEISRATMIADQRAWVAVGELRIENDLLFRKPGADLSISVKVSNVGKTPAHQTGFVFDLFECESDNPTNFVDSIRPNKGTLRVEQVGWDGGPGGFAD